MRSVVQLVEAQPVKTRVDILDPNRAAAGLLNRTTVEIIGAVEGKPAHAAGDPLRTRVSIVSGVETEPAAVVAIEPPTRQQLVETLRAAYREAERLTDRIDAIERELGAMKREELDAGELAAVETETTLIQPIKLPPLPRTEPPQE